MEPAAAWAPCEFQLANWSIEESEPTGGLPLPVEYVSVDIQGNTHGLEALCVPEYYYYSAASPHNVRSEKVKLSNDSHAQCVMDQVTGEFKADIDMMKAKMHRYPSCLGDVDESYTVPRIVAIGPYHHGRDHLKQAEKVKHAAACHCVRLSGRTLQELFDAVVQVADDNASRLYDKDVMAGIGREDFRHMMFFDACFLVQFMLMRAHTGVDVVDQSLNSFLSPNRVDIFHDVMLLENQLPWHVVETVISFMRVPRLPKMFVFAKRHCMMSDDRHEPREQKPFIWYESYKPPHLLGLLRYYIVGRSDIEYPKLTTNHKAYSMSAMELAEIGITLTANKTMQLTDMRLNQKGTPFAELSLSPLSLDRDCASFLVNMAALELCTVESFSAAQDEEDSAVCSYVVLLAMLVYREEDVHKLREQRILVGGGGLTNEEALRFFTSFQGIRFGPYYYRIMAQIQIYRDSNQMKTKSFAFFHNHIKTIVAAVSGVVSVGGIIGTLLSISK